jgi:predicted MFS family arabinose efflux permease
MVADLVAPERRQAAYASVRVAANMGVVVGPPLGGLLLVVGGWTALFPCVAVLSGISWLIAYRYLPRRGAVAPDGPPDRGSLSVILADRRFLLFLGSAVFAWLTYVAYEVVLPVSLVDGYGYEPAAWGFLVWVNPLLVALFQVRLTRLATPIPPAPKLVLALLVMGLPFLLLVWTQGLPAIVFVIVVFVVGEMLWGADLAGGRCRARAGRHPRRLRGRLRQRAGDRLRARAADRAPDAEQLRRRGDLGDVRRDRDRRGRARGSCARRPRPARAAGAVCCT